jgi:hypothetical protein
VKLPLAVAATLAVFVPPPPALAEAFDDVAFIDTMCLASFKGKVETHTRDCALQCVQGGFGIVLKDGQFLRFDEAGNKLAEEALKASTKEKDLRVSVVGDRQDDTLKVKSLKLK